jgi:hypothetical protein
LVVVPLFPREREIQFKEVCVEPFLQFLSRHQFLPRQRQAVAPYPATGGAHGERPSVGKGFS